MTHGLNRSLARGPKIRSPIRKLTIPLSAFALSIVGASGNGFGGAAIAGLPEGNILFLGAVADSMVFTAGANATTTFTGTFGVGTAVASAVTLATTMQNIVPVGVLNAATASVSPATRLASTTSGTIIDNTDKTLAVFLNMTIDDASISGTSPVTVSGLVVISYVVLGDD